MSVNGLINTKSDHLNMLDSLKTNKNVYHAVFVNEKPTTPETEELDNELHVYQDKLDALKVIKKYKTGRLKTFSSWEEAEKYARYGDSLNYSVNGSNVDGKVVAENSCKPVDEKGPNFKSLKPQELVVFRKLIETGDLEGVKNCIWENPRYLVGVSGNPTILQEGPRYNALHVATSKSSDAFNMCKLVLDVISDPNFIELIDGIEETASYVNKSQVFIEAFLNTPNKGLNETPLHFAVKYGLKDVVALLVSYPQCSRTAKNKHGQTPMEIICDRKPLEDDGKLIREIRALLEDQYYVPVIRSEDNSLAPAIGEPFSPASPPRLVIDPISPRLEVKAFAGPMTKPQALEFRKKWKTPPRMLFGTPKRDTSINDPLHLEKLDCRLIDLEKGLERVGRDLAEEYHVSWKEFWPFLNEFADLKSTSGLDKLEKYLSKLQRFKTINSVKQGKSYPKFKSIKNLSKDFKTANCIQSDNKDDIDDIKPIDFYSKQEDEKNLLNKFENNFIDKKDNDMDALIKNMELLILNSPKNVVAEEKFYTPPSSPLPFDDYSDFSEDSSSEDEMFMPSEGHPVFIQGSVPSKIDIAVLNALPETIDPEVYPLIYQWKHDLQLAVRKNDISVNLIIVIVFVMAGGVCLSCKIIDRIRDTSLDIREDFGLKSHSFAIRSHSVPGSTSPASATNCFSAFLLKKISTLN
ncbi:Similar to Ankle2: Ankyrin repeat and LEM domain-containing protein 2 (Mus musculus), partial [Cotesia congregata]